MQFKKQRLPYGWFEKIRPRILKLANYKCEKCGRVNHSFYIKEKGQVINVMDDFQYQWLVSCGINPKQVTLNVTHLNYNANDNRDENLIALCAQCLTQHKREKQTFLKRNLYK